MGNTDSKTPEAEKTTVPKTISHHRGYDRFVSKSGSEFVTAAMPETVVNRATAQYQLPLNVKTSTSSETRADVDQGAFVGYRTPTMKTKADVDQGAFPRYRTPTMVTKADVDQGAFATYRTPTMVTNQGFPSKQNSSLANQQTQNLASSTYAAAVAIKPHAATNVDFNLGKTITKPNPTPKFEADKQYPILTTKCNPNNGMNEKCNDLKSPQREFPSPDKTPIRPTRRNENNLPLNVKSEIAKEALASQSDLTVPLSNVLQNKTGNKNLKTLEKDDFSSENNSTHWETDSELSDSGSESDNSEIGNDLRSFETDLNIANLMPIASTQNKEVVTVTKEGDIMGKEAHIRRMLNTVFLLEYLVHFVNEKFGGKFYLKNIVEIENCCSKPFVRVIHSYPGHNFEDRLEEFVLSFNFVFVTSSDASKAVIRYSISANSNEFIESSYQSLIKDIILYLIGEDRKELETMVQFVREVFNPEPFPRYANCTVAQLKTFALGYPSEFHVDQNGLVHIVETLKAPKLQETKSLRMEVISFFENEMKLAGGLFVKDLTKLLSWKKSELLANLEDRSPESVFQILKSSNNFESKDNKIFLKSAMAIATAKQQPVIETKPALKTLTTPSNDSKTALKTVTTPSNDSKTALKTLTTPSNDTKTAITTILKSEESSNACCMVGTIFSVGKVSGSIWCAPGSNSKTVFARFNIGTSVNGNVVLDFSSCLKTGDKVMFSASSSNFDGLITWTAAKILTSSIVGRNYKCPVCKKDVVINQANSPTNITNGIALDDKKTFYWNVKGTIVAIGKEHMTIACYLSKKSNRQRMNVFCDKNTLMLNTEANPVYDFNQFAYEQVVDCDVLLTSFNNEMLWVAIEVRSAPVNYEEVYKNPRIAYNCEGIVTKHLNGSGIVKVVSSQTNKTIQGQMAEYNHKKTWFIKSHFPVSNFDKRLKLWEDVKFDAILGPNGKWNMYLIRKTLRPLPNNVNAPEVESKPIVITAADKALAVEKANKIYLEEMSEVTKALAKSPYNLISALDDTMTMDQSVIGKNKRNGVSQTMSTGPIVTVSNVGSSL